MQALPYSTRPLEAAYDVLEELKAGKVMGRVVLGLMLALALRPMPSNRSSCVAPGVDRIVLGQQLDRTDEDAAQERAEQDVSQA